MTPVPAGILTSVHFTEAPYVPPVPPVTYSSVVLVDGPTLYWRLGETSGTTAVDSSTNGRNGTYSGAYTLGSTGLVTGDTDKSVTFSGGSVTRASEGWQGTVPFTLEAIINATDAAGYAVIASAEGQSGVTRGWTFRINPSWQLEAVDGRAGAVILTAGTLIAGTTYHVAWVATGAGQKIFVNGVLMGQNTTGLVAGGLSFDVGMTHGGLGGVYQTFPGRIDEVARYPTALSDARIYAHAQAAGLASAYPGAVLADGPGLYWRFSSATVCEDSSGNGRVGTYEASTTAVAPGLLPGDAGGARDFAGTAWPGGGGVSLPWAAWQNATVFTAEAIIRANAVNGQRSIITNDGDGLGAGAPNRWWNFLVEDGKLRVIDLHTPVAGIVLTGATTLQLGRRYHVAMVWSATDVRLYLDGVLDGTAAQPLAAPLGNSRVFLVGASVSGSSSVGITHRLIPWNGRIDEVAWYPTALSAARILAHATAAGVPEPLPPTGGYEAALLVDTPTWYFPLNDVAPLPDDQMNYATSVAVNGGSLVYGAAGIGDRATSMDFAGGRIEVGPNPTPFTAFTVECLFQRDITGSYHNLMTLDPGSGTGRTYIFRVTNTNKLEGIIFSGPSSPQFIPAGATTIISGVKYHAAMTFDGTVGKVYLNGVQDASLSATFTVNPTSGGMKHVLGGDYGANFPFDGRMAGAAFYTKALSAARILAHAQAAGLA